MVTKKNNHWHTTQFLHAASFGSRLRSLRKSRGLNQTMLADQLNLARSTIGKYETGDRFPDQGGLARLAAFFDVPIDYLLQGNTQIHAEMLLNPQVDVVYKGMPIDNRQRLAIRQILEKNAWNAEDPGPLPKPPKA